MRRLLLMVLVAIGIAAFVRSADDGLIQERVTSESLGYYRILSASEAWERVEAGSITVLDVRSQSEYAQGHIPGAICVPGKSLETLVPALLPDKNTPVLVCSRTGLRADAAAAALAEMGYTDVSNCGGLVDWPYELVR